MSSKCSFCGCNHRMGQMFIASPVRRDVFVCDHCITDLVALRGDWQATHPRIAARRGALRVIEGGRA